jgi:hypothetical protein
MGGRLHPKPGALQEKAAWYATGDAGPPEEPPSSSNGVYYKSMVYIGLLKQLKFVSMVLVER